MGQSVRVELFDAIVRHYQKSKNFQTKTLQWKRLKIREGKNKILKDVDQRDILNALCIELEKEGYLKIDWEERHHLIRDVLYHTSFYSYYLERSSYEDYSLHNEKCLENIKNIQSQVTQTWIKSALESLYQKEKKQICIDEIKLDHLLKAFQQLDENMDSHFEVPMRIFSRMCYDDSKLFENEVKSTMIAYIKQEYLHDVSINDDSYILKEVGILKSSLDLMFKGAMTITLKGQPVDLSLFEDGISLAIPTLNKIETICLSDTINRIISIENKTNFLSASFKSDTLYIYTHGFCSEEEISFINRILDVKQGLEVYHFSDIDLGGFRIFHHLESRLHCCLLPYHMDKETLIHYQKHGQKINDAYIKKLQQLSMPLFQEVIDYMTTYRIKLEQEALLVE